MKKILGTTLIIVFMVIVGCATTYCQGPPQFMVLATPMLFYALIQYPRLHGYFAFVAFMAVTYYVVRERAENVGQGLRNLFSMGFIALAIGEWVRAQVNQRRMVSRELTLTNLAIENARHPIVLVALNADGVPRTVYANPAFLRVMGYSHEEVLKEDFPIGLAEEQLNELLPRVTARLNAQGHYSFPANLARADGVVRETEWTLQMVSNSLGATSHWVGSMEDVTERNAAQDALKQSERRYRELVENLNDAIYRVDPSGVVTYVSPVIENFTGRPPSEFMGRKITDHVCADDMRLLMDAYARTLNGARETIEFRIRCRDGQLAWMRTLAVAQREGQTVVGIQGVLTDISALKRSAHALEAQHAQLETFVARSPAAVAMLDARACYVVASKSWERQHALENQRLFGASFYDTMPGGREVWQALCDGCLHGHVQSRDGMPIPGQESAGRFVRLDMWPWYLDAESVGGVIIFTEDVTQERQQQEALRLSERRFRQMFETNVAVQLIIDPETGTILDANHAATRFYGYSREELRAMSVADLNLLPAEEVRILMRRVLQQRYGSLSFQHRLKSGEVRDIDVLSGPVEVDGQDFLHSIVIDRTEEKYLARERQQSLRTLETLVESMPDAICLRESAGVFVLSNAAFKTLESLAVSCVENPGETFAERLKAGDRQVVAQRHRRHAELRVRTIGDLIFYLDVVQVPILDMEGNVVSVLTVCRDMTEHKV